jgi:hypothetical protein
MSQQIYYHYLSSDDAIDDLKKSRIRVSTFDTLNDPFEMMPYRRYSSEARQPYNRVLRKISKKWGLLSFSKTWIDQLLWAHYADKHKGIALGFGISGYEILKVDYTPDKIREKLELTDDEEKNEEKFLSLAKGKYQEWAYEKEYRILVELNDCKPEKGNFFIPFGKGLEIEEIVLGCRLDSEEDREKVSRLANDLGAEIIQTRPGWEDYKIHRCGTKTNQLKAMQAL